MANSKNSFILYSIQVISKILVDFLYFPLWWYSLGLLKALKSLGGFLKAKQQQVGLDVWLKNIGKPMYGQNDWAGVLISFIMRLVQIVFRSIVMFFWLIVAFIALLIWVIFPIFIVYNIFSQLSGIIFS